MTTRKDPQPQVRMCWPTPGPTCLEGGCTFCRHWPWRNVSTIRNYAWRKKLMKHYWYGYNSQWPNLPKRDWPT